MFPGSSSSSSSSRAHRVGMEAIMEQVDVDSNDAIKPDHGVAMSTSVATTASSPDLGSAGVGTSSSPASPASSSGVGGGDAEMTPPSSPPDVRSSSPIPHHGTHASAIGDGGRVAAVEISTSSSTAVQDNAAAVPVDEVNDSPLARFQQSCGSQASVESSRRTDVPFAGMSASTASLGSSVIRFFPFDPEHPFRSGLTSTVADPQPSSFMLNATGNAAAQASSSSSSSQPQTYGCPSAPASLSGSNGVRLLDDRFLLLEQSDAIMAVTAGNLQQPPPSSHSYKCIEVKTAKTYTCKVSESTYTTRGQSMVVRRQSKPTKSCDFLPRRERGGVLCASARNET